MYYTSHVCVQLHCCDATFDVPKGSTWVQIFYAMSHVTFILSLCRHVTFYKTLTSLSTVFIKGHVGLLQLLKWPCRTSFFTHVEPYKVESVPLYFKSTELSVGDCLTDICSYTFLRQKYHGRKSLQGYGKPNITSKRLIPLD